MVSGQLLFISGGVRSGKSAFAETHLLNESKKDSGRLVYIASGKVTDAEMKARIERHKQDRILHNWTTIEQPTALENVLSLIQEGDYVLWDCVTTWLANELYEGIEEDAACMNELGCIERKVAALYETIDAIRAKAYKFIIVSNEVFDEPTSLYEETTIYTKWLGLIHQKIVRKATTAIEMDNGLPIYWKGVGGK